MQIISTSSRQIDLSAIFYGVEKRTTYTLRGMIAYYGRHYSAFFHCRSRGQWLNFDDEKIKVIGDSWDDVSDNCCAAHWQPSVLFYEREQEKHDLPTTVAIASPRHPPALGVSPTAFAATTEAIGPYGPTTATGPVFDLPFGVSSSQSFLLPASHFINTSPLSAIARPYHASNGHGLYGLRGSVDSLTPLYTASPPMNINRLAQTTHYRNTTQFPTQTASGTREAKPRRHKYGRKRKRNTTALRKGNGT